jgi:hypothetical protein
MACTHRSKRKFDKEAPAGHEKVKNFFHTANFDYFLSSLHGSDLIVYP